MENHEQYQDKGLTGLANIGNTCYLNSCMQVLSHTYELNDFLNPEKYKKKLNQIPDSILLLEWDKLRKLMWSENCTVAPHGFVQAIQKISSIKNKQLFSGFSQNDVSEFLLFIIESFHNSLSREVDMDINGSIKNNTDGLAVKCYEMMKNMYSKSYSEMLEMFFGISVSHIKSVSSQETLSCNPEPFCILSLSIPNDKPSLSILDCLDDYCKSERLENENAYLNEKTGLKEDVDKGIIFWSLPNVLIIDIKRYNTQGKKLQNLIDVPLENLDLSKYVIGYNKSSYVYELYGVCNHSGGTSGGHYTCSIKNANGKWYEINDTFINEINANKVISNKSYCFFFRKKNSRI
jgi:ubiquitin C-terminal hydrolase